jgi:hypothetical protein
VTRLRVVALALVLVSTGLLPCLCVGMAAAEPPGEHCGSAEPAGPGLASASHGCACTCLSASPADTAAPRIEPAFASASLADPVALPSTRARVVTAHRLPAVESPPTTSPPILRI